MKLGLFLMPSHPPERDFKAGQEWDLEMLRIADRLGYDEAWIGDFTNDFAGALAAARTTAPSLHQVAQIADVPAALYT